jgi:hypothetical protein
MDIEKKKWEENFRGISKREIRNKKRVVRKDKYNGRHDFTSIEDVIGVLEELSKNYYIFIQRNINPLPKDKYGNEATPNWFWKRAATANVPRVTAKKCKEQNIILPNEEIKSLEKISLSNYSSLCRRGTSWTGISDNSKRIIPLIYLIHGFKLYALMKEKELNVKVRDYTHGTLVEGILSRSNPKERRDVTFRSLPITKENKEYLVETFNFQSQSTSPGYGYRTLDEKYKPKEIVFGPEEIAAYVFRAMTKTTKKIERDESGKKEKIKRTPKILINPFLAPTPLLIRFYNKLINNTLVYHKKIKDDGSIEHTDKKPTYSQINSILFHYVGIKGPKACFIECENLNENLVNYVRSYINKK